MKKIFVFLMTMSAVLSFYGFAQASEGEQKSFGRALRTEGLIAICAKKIPDDKAAQATCLEEQRDALEDVTFISFMADRDLATENKILAVSLELCKRENAEYADEGLMDWVKLNQCLHNMASDIIDGLKSE